MDDEAIKTDVFHAAVRGGWDSDGANEIAKVVLPVIKRANLTAWRNGLESAAALADREGHATTAAAIRLFAKFDPEQAEKARQEIAAGKFRVL